jgi:hypothetical protein
MKTTPRTEGEDKLDKATLIFNFFDELRRMTPAA